MVYKSLNKMRNKFHSLWKKRFVDGCDIVKEMYESVEPKKVLPPVSLLGEKDKLQLIEKLNKLNFALGSLKAA